MSGAAAVNRIISHLVERSDLGDMADPYEIEDIMISEELIARCPGMSGHPCARFRQPWRPFCPPHEKQIREAAAAITAADAKKGGD